MEVKARRGREGDEGCPRLNLHVFSDQASCMAPAVILYQVIASF